MSEFGGIRAKRIHAENVVDGVQLYGSGGNIEHREFLTAFRQRGISADDIIASNVVSGLQHISDPNDATLQQIRSEIAELRSRISAAAAGVELGDAQTAIEAAYEEASSHDPDGGRLTSTLRDVSDVLAEAAEGAEHANKLTDNLIKLATAAAAVWAAVAKFFGLG